MDYKKLILERKSVRDYKKNKVDEKLLNQLKNYYKSERKLVDGIEIEVLIKEKDDVFQQLQGIAGYKNNMIEAPHYIIILSDKKDNYIENTGYIGENLILKACELGIGSCWITFKDPYKIKEKLNIKSDMELTAIIALGYDNNKIKVVNTNKQGYNPSKADIIVSQDNTSHRFSVEEVVFMNEWGSNASADDLSNRGLLDGFFYARLAPSTLNRQPWRFIVDDDVVVLAVRKDEHIKEYEELIDVGIVMLYFETIIDSTLFDLTWHLKETDKKYNIPDDFLVVGYCNI